MAEYETIRVACDGAVAAYRRWTGRRCSTRSTAAPVAELDAAFAALGAETRRWRASSSPAPGEKAFVAGADIGEVEALDAASGTARSP